jgi:hypothetical protein
MVKSGMLVTPQSASIMLSQKFFQAKNTLAYFNQKVKVL